MIFNRPDETAQAFEAIRKARPPRLYVNADGPRPHRPDDRVLCEKARAVVKQVDWPCELHYRFSEKNEGCRWSVSGALKWFFDAEPEGIVIEDDLIADLTFFQYCDELLERYRHDNEVFSINGSNYGYQPTWPESYGFTMFMNMSGWATWRRSYQLFDPNMASWTRLPRWNIPLLYLYLRGRLWWPQWEKLGWASYWRNRFDATVNWEVNSWGYIWVYTALKYRKKSIVPRVNMLRNIGWGSSSTHMTDPNDPAAKIMALPIRFPLVHPEEEKPDEVYDRHAMQHWARFDWTRVGRRRLVRELVRILIRGN